jgi:zinc/manganese transport system permease protein
MSVLFREILARLVLLCVIVGSISSIVGIFVSGLFNFASDPSIVIVQFVVYFFVFAWVKLKTKAA